MGRGRLTLIDLEIDRLKKSLQESDRKLEYLTGSERTEELYRNGNLHHQMRKITNEANKDDKTFYCSQCGDRFKKWRDRVEHVRTNHAKMG